MKFTFVLALTGLVFGQTAHAGSNWLYPVPITPLASAQQQAMDCRQLESAIHDLTPLTYSYKPGFYDDPYQGSAVLAGGTVAAPVLIVPIYNAWVETQERKRIRNAQRQIAVIRQLKAEKQCFIQ